ncbi:MAG: glutamine--fructose-6-phosphate transaminase (isomerizing) [Candidatus Heimdallarchaeota archaeon]|nr:glutamine--fructose-6-phosphate transaminase (isomerizing) [Candidatus Heimdallarchaeota archaeon]MCK4954416.1 glutamine--fructose-6-phosphate transaminase (isomerizing) [Candidatus Heimdallarchaeota archaeon]
MCGIVGIVQQKKTKIGKDIVDALTRLEYRGYDSVGIASISNGKILITKDEGKIAEVVEKVNIGNIIGKIAIGHTRWATHGPPSKENAHPHTDCSGEISVIHNGIIENFQQLKEELVNQGHVFQSDTDTEIIPHMIEHLIKKNGLTLKDAIIQTVKRIEGTFAICVVSNLDPDKIYCAKRDSPLVIGINSDRMFCASDIPAFLTQTRKVVLLHDEEFVTLSYDGYEIINFNTMKEVIRKPHIVSWKPEMAQKAGFPHFMLKEIHEQPNSLADYIRIKQPSLSKITEKLYNAKKIFLLAAGTAHYSTLTGEQLIRKYAEKPATSIISSEYESISSLIDEDTVILPVSQSGETMDTIMAIKHAKDLGATILSAVNVIGSTITRYSDEVLYLYAGPEIGVAATKTYTAQTISMWDIGLELGKISGKINNAEYTEARELFNKIPSVVKQTIVRNEARTNHIASWFAKKNSSFYLGRNLNLQTAKEGALKMKEIAYIHSEAYPAGESKHGPIALVEEDYPIVFVTPNDQSHKRIISNIMEMKARGATAIAVLEEGDKEIGELAKWKLEIPKGCSEMFATIPYVVPLQLLAYYTATRKGLDCDRPRSLAKAVTVL